MVRGVVRMYHSYEFLLPFHRGLFASLLHAIWYLHHSAKCKQPIGEPILPRVDPLMFSSIRDMRLLLRHSCINSGWPNPVPWEIQNTSAVLFRSYDKVEIRQRYRQAVVVPCAPMRCLFIDNVCVSLMPLSTVGAHILPYKSKSILCIYIYKDRLSEVWGFPC